MPVEGREDKNKMPVEGREDKNKMPVEGREDKNKLRTIKNYKCKIPICHFIFVDLSICLC
jgi:5S rRNA maturation endonuclease (ribonuclease M5)